MCFVCGTWSSPRWCMSESLTICTTFCVKHAVVRGSTSPTASAPSINCSIVPRAIAERCSTSVSKLLHSPTGNNRTLLYIGLDVRHLCGAARAAQKRRRRPRVLLTAYAPRCSGSTLGTTLERCQRPRSAGPANLLLVWLDVPEARARELAREAGAGIRRLAVVVLIALDG